MVLAAAGQFGATASIIENIAAVQILIRKAVEAGAKTLFLPEASDYIAASPEQTISLAQPISSSPFIASIQRELERHQCLELSIGVHEPTEDGKKVKNSLLWFDRKGNLSHNYQKIHLFDVNIKDGPILLESKSVERGCQVHQPVTSAIGKVGLAICYDIRFPEHCMRLRSLGSQVIIYPSAFTVKTGQAHWEVLGRARAIDSQCYIIMPGQVGPHDAGKVRNSWGHSMIIDPWGTVLAQCPDVDNEPRICLADIDLDSLERVRRNMPLWQQRRPDVYGYQV